MSKPDLLISVILDRSGSMATKVSSVIEHFNNYKEEVSHIPYAHMSIFQFDTEYETIVENTPIKDVPDLTREVYYARGGTALLDAIGRTIKSIDAFKDAPSKIIIVINTDGFENSSHEYNKAQIKEMVTERQDNHDWQFVFVGAGIDAFTVGTSIGLRGGSTWTAPNTEWGYGSTYNVLSAATLDYVGNISSTVDMEKSGINLGVTQTTEETDEVKNKAKKKETSGKSTR